MPEAIFRITAVGGDEVARVLAKITAATVRSQTQIGAQSARSSRESTRYADAHVKAWERAERERSRTALREAAERKRAEERAQKEIQRVEREATRIAAAEARKQTKEATQASREKEIIAKKLLAVRRAAEQEATRDADAQERTRLANLKENLRQAVKATEQAAAQEERARVDAKRRTDRALAAGGRMGARVANMVAGGVSSFASTMHGQIQDARERRAVTERVLNTALYQAGAGTSRDNDAASLRARVFQFAQQNNIDSAQLAAGLNAAQTEFSVLGNSRSTQADRRANLERTLQAAQFANDTGQDMGEVMRVQGMLQNAELSPTAQRQTLLALTGMAQRGAIELGSVTRTAMAPMQARIGQALAGLRPDADEATKAHVTQQAVKQTMAEMEVGRGLGYTPRNLGNIMTQLGGSLQSNVTQQKMLTNIRNATGLSADRRHDIETKLFARDSHGRSRLRAEYQSGFGLAQGLTEAFRGDSVAMQNVFAGGGQGNPQALQANWRRVMGAFMGEGNENVRAMMEGAGTAFTQEDVSRGAGLFRNDALAKLQGDKEAHDTALTDNTSQMKKLSDAFASFVARNPMTAAAGQAALSAAGGSLVGAAGTGIGRAVAGGALRTSVGALASGASLGAGATAVAGIGAAALGGLAIGDQIQRRMGIGAPGASVFNASTWKELFGGIKDAIKDGMRDSRVTISPHDAAHAAGQASVRR